MILKLIKIESGGRQTDCNHPPRQLDSYDVMGTLINVEQLFQGGVEHGLVHVDLDIKFVSKLQLLPTPSKDNEWYWSSPYQGNDDWTKLMFIIVTVAT